MIEPDDALDSIAERRTDELMPVFEGLLYDSPFQWDSDKLEFIRDNILAQVRVAIQEYVGYTAAWLSRNGGVNGTSHANALQARAGNEDLV